MEHAAWSRGTDERRPVRAIRLSAPAPALKRDVGGEWVVVGRARAGIRSAEQFNRDHGPASTSTQVGALRFPRSYDFSDIRHMSGPALSRPKPPQPADRRDELKGASGQRTPKPTLSNPHPPTRLNNVQRTSHLSLSCLLGRRAGTGGREARRPRGGSTPHGGWRQRQRKLRSAATRLGEYAEPADGGGARHAWQRGWRQIGPGRGDVIRRLVYVPQALQ